MSDTSGRKEVDLFWATKHKDPEFLRQRDEWYAKAKETGFVDLEMVDQKTKEPATHLLKGMSPGDLWRGLYKPDAEEYFSLARAHVHSYRLSSRPVDRAVWAMWAEGHRAPAIHRALGQRTGVTVGRIKAIIKAEERAMLQSVEKAHAGK